MSLSSIRPALGAPPAPPLQFNQQSINATASSYVPNARMDAFMLEHGQGADLQAETEQEMHMGDVFPTAQIQLCSDTKIIWR
jgi:hypothetical protein